jgi:hypothetical protein
VDPVEQPAVRLRIPCLSPDEDVIWKRVALGVVIDVGEDVDRFLEGILRTRVLLTCNRRRYPI